MAFPAFLAVISALLLLCTPSATFASVTPSELASDIRTVTSQALALQPIAQSINIFNGPLITIGQGPYPQIMKGFGDMVTGMLEMIQRSQETEPFKGSDTKAIATAVRDLVQVHQVLLNVLIGKGGLFQTFPMVLTPVRASLASYEATIDTFLFQVAYIASADAESIAAAKNSLDVTIEAALKTYTGSTFVQ